jgi:hypothetical protein
MARRTRSNTLSAEWSKKEKDIVFYHPDGPQTKCDGHFLYSSFSVGKFDHNAKLQKAFLDELEARGYDITTLRFSICKKEGHERWKEENNEQ